MAARLTAKTRQKDFELFLARNFGIEYRGTTEARIYVGMRT